MITLYYNIAKYERKNYEPRSEGSGAVVEVVEKLRRFLEKYVLENQNLSWDTHQSILALFADVVVYKDTIECISPGVFRQVKNVYRYSELNDVQKKYVLTKISKYFTFIRNKCKDVLLNPEEKAETKELAKFFYNVSQPKSLGVMLNFPDDSCIYVVNSTPVISLSGWKHVKLSDQVKEIYSLIPEDSEDDEEVNLSVDAVDPIEQYYSTYHYFNENDLPYAHPDLKDLNAKFGDLLESVSASEIKDLWPNAANERFLPNPEENQTGEVKVSSSDEDEEDPDPASFNFKTNTSTQASVSSTAETSTVTDTSASTSATSSSDTTSNTNSSILFKNKSKTKLTEFGGDIDFENIVYDKSDIPKITTSSISEDEIVVVENQDEEVVVKEENTTEESILEKDAGVDAILEESKKKPLVSQNDKAEIDEANNTFDVEGEVVKENNTTSAKNTDVKKSDIDKTKVDTKGKTYNGGNSKMVVMLMSAILLVAGAFVVFYFMLSNDAANNADNNQANTITQANITTQASSQYNDAPQGDDQYSAPQQDYSTDYSLSNNLGGNEEIATDAFADNALVDNSNQFSDSLENTNSIDDFAVGNVTEELNASNNTPELEPAPTSAVEGVSNTASSNTTNALNTSNTEVTANVPSKDIDNEAKKIEEVTTPVTTTTTAIASTSDVSQQQTNSKVEENHVQGVSNTNVEAAVDSNKSTEENAKQNVSASSEFENVAVAFFQGYSDKIKTTIKKNGSEICTIRARFEYVTDKVVLSTKNTDVKNLCGYDISAIECKSDFTNCYFVFVNDEKKEMQKVQSEGVTSKLGKKNNR